MERTLASHALTVVVTLVLVMAFLGGRLGLRRVPLVAQVPLPVQEREQEAEAVQGQGTPSGPNAPEDAARLAPPPPVPVADVRAPVPPQDVLKDLDQEERNNVLVYAAVNKSVVNITTESEGYGFFGDETSTGTGSGFVIDKQGHVLTNFHVIQGAASVRVDPLRWFGRARRGSSVKTRPTT